MTPTVKIQFRISRLLIEIHQKRLCCDSAPISEFRNEHLTYCLLSESYHGSLFFKKQSLRASFAPWEVQMNGPLLGVRNMKVQMSPCFAGVLKCHLVWHRNVSQALAPHAEWAESGSLKPWGIIFSEMTKCLDSFLRAISSVTLPVWPTFTASYSHCRTSRPCLSMIS